MWWHFVNSHTMSCWTRTPDKIITLFLRKNIFSRKSRFLKENSNNGTSRLGKALEEKFTILLVFCTSASVGRFFFVNNTLQALEPSTFRRNLRFNFSNETDFEPIFCTKQQRNANPFGSSPVCLTTRLKRSSLLNVYHMSYNKTPLPGSDNLLI